MPVVNFKLKDRLTEKVYEISAPIGDRIDTTSSGQHRYQDLQGARYVNEGTEENPQWVVSETLDYSFKRRYSIIFNYAESDLNNNYIELSEEHELYDGSNSPNNSEVVVDIVGAGGSMRFALWSETVVEQGQTVTKLHSSCSSVGNSGWYRPNYGYPPGVAIGTTSDFGAMNAIYVQNLYVPDGKKPKISFHVETAKHGDYEYPILVISGWYGYVDSSGEEPVVRYGVRWQRAISTSFAFGTSEMQPTKTPSKTPNTTPSGGMGNRNNISQNVPMPGADGLAAFSKYASGNASGIHLYKISVTNWAGLEQELWNDDLLSAVTQSVGRGVVVQGKQGLAQYIISAVRIGVPISVSGASYSVTVGKFDFKGGTYSAVTGEILNSRFTDSDVYEFDIPFYSKTFLDYDPMTKIQVHIPYCGVVSVSPDRCIGGKIQIKYIIDLITGDCTAIVRTIDQFENTCIAAVLAGKCGVSIPFVTNEVDMEKIAGSIFSIATGALSGNVGGVAKGALGIVSANQDLIDSTKVGNTSSVGGMSAIMGDRALYVAVYHPQDLTGYSIEGIDEIDNFGNKVGYAAASFCKVSEIGDGQYLEAIINPNSIQTATDEEKEAIRSIIQRGVYI